MVRLQLASQKSSFTISSSFQSHYGAIATKLRHPAGHDIDDFQSHYGAIATHPPPRQTTQPTFFQSHYGAIATLLMCVVVYLGWLTFNPTMVRLQLLHARRRDTQSSSLSIPLWCDCNGAALSGTATSSGTFNPTMVRLQPLPLCTCHRNRKAFNPTMVRLQHTTSPTPQTADFLSIPLWCDCNCVDDGRELGERELSIPLWCDCNRPTTTATPTACPLSIPLWCDCNYIGERGM